MTKKAEITIVEPNKNKVHHLKKSPRKNQISYNNQTYRLDEEKMDHDDEKPAFLFRAGNPEPKPWKRWDGKFKPHDFYTIRHETTTMEGIANMLGIGGAGSLKKSQWAIILGAVGALIVAFIILYPKIMGMLGM